MRGFAAGEIDVLVATTVIEVRIDVPNATVMVIEGAERFGVSQLHQLRGRVGRGEHSSYCLLFAAEVGGMARRRLKAVAAERDGFKLAEVDLSLRGEGEILGTRRRRPSALRGGRAAAGHADLDRRPRGALALLRRHGSLEDAALGPLLDAARRRFGASAADPNSRCATSSLESLAGRAWSRRVAGRSAPLPTASARRSSRPWGGAGAQSGGYSTSTAGPAPSRSRRSRAAPSGRCSSIATLGRRSATSSGWGWASAPSWSGPRSAAGSPPTRRVPPAPASTSSSSMPRGEPANRC